MPGMISGMLPTSSTGFFAAGNGSRLLVKVPDPYRF
jgi:hypothetical protein